MYLGSGKTLPLPCDSFKNAHELFLTSPYSLVWRSAMSSLSCMLILFCLNLLLTLAELKASDDGGTMEKEQGPKMVLQYVPVLVTNDTHTL